jgi:superfamily I DNA/RNA helicase
VILLHLQFNYAGLLSIKLMTMHTSKGLEFPVVFIPGLGYLPNAQGAIADEARLLYVSMTRAIEVLVLTGDGEARWKRSPVCVRGSAEGSVGEGGVELGFSLASS